MITFGKFQDVCGGMRITAKPKLKAACGATFDDHGLLRGHEVMCTTCVQIRYQPDLVSPLAMQDDCMAPDDLLQFDAGALDGFVVSRRFRIENKPFAFWQLDSASSACVKVPDCDCVVSSEVSVPADLLARLYEYASKYCVQVPFGAPRITEIREDLNSTLELLGRKKVWT